MGFDLGFRQLDEGNLSVPVNVLFGENVTLTQMRFATGFHQLGSPLANE